MLHEGKNPCPYYKMFDEFNEYWHQLDLINYHELLTVRHDNVHKQSIIQFCQDQLTRYHAQNDYKECLHLSLIVLGQCPENYVFKIPGPYHKAQWMCVVIYTLKIYLFRVQLGL